MTGGTAPCENWKMNNCLTTAKTLGRAHMIYLYEGTKYASIYKAP